MLFTASLEDALQNALKNYLPRLESTSDPRTEFYNKFKREADEYDNDFLGKYRGDLDTTLIFVGLPLFSRPLRLRCSTDFGGIGWFVLHSHIRFHRRHSDPAPTGLHSIELRYPSGDGRR